MWPSEELVGGHLNCASHCLAYKFGVIHPVEASNHALVGLTVVGLQV